MLLLFRCCFFWLCAFKFLFLREVDFGQEAGIDFAQHLVSLSLLKGNSLSFDFLCFLCFFEAFALFLGSEIVVDASLDLGTVKLSRFVLYYRLKDLGGLHRALASRSVLFGFSGNLERKVI